MSKFFEVRISVQVDDEYSESVRAPGRDKTMPVNWSDVEWAFQDLFYDDDDGNPNFTIGSINGIIVEEVNCPSNPTEHGFIDLDS